MSARFSDEQARAILARAIEIDVRAPTATEEDLRAIASDVGISQFSLDAALREHATAPTPRRVTAGQRASTMLAGMGLPLGMVAGSLLMSGNFLVSLGLTGAGLLLGAGLVVCEGATGTLRSFHLKNLLLWGGVAAGGMVAVLFFGADPARMPVLISVGWGIRGWITSSILGSAAMIAVRRARQGDSRPGTDGMDRSGAAEGGLLTRGLKRVLGLFGRPLWRATQQLSRASVRPAVLSSRRV